MASVIGCFGDFNGNGVFRSDRIGSVAWESIDLRLPFDFAGFLHDPSKYTFTARSILFEAADRMISSDSVGSCSPTMLLNSSTSKPFEVEVAGGAGAAVVPLAVSMWLVPC